tara:strand:- start:127 stop:798 length:672 start_codon:yes stop_codon:yes gene_type:complete
MSTDALAHTAGAFFLRARSAPPSDALGEDVRTKLKATLDKYEANVSGYITIGHRYLLLHIEDAEVNTLWTEVANHWYAQQRISFAHLILFLSGYFDTSASASLNATALGTLCAEIERVGDGLPPRFQHLFFELASVLEEYDENDLEVDLTQLKDSIALHRFSFPNLPVSAIRGTKKQKTDVDPLSERQESNAPAADKGSDDAGLDGDNGLDDGQKVRTEGVVV